MGAKLCAENILDAQRPARYTGDNDILYLLGGLIMSETIVVIGANHAGTAAINTILDNYRDKHVVVFDRSSAISFSFAGGAPRTSSSGRIRRKAPG